MPEGDAVWRTCRRLHEALAGDVLVGSELRVPAHAAADLRGRRTIEVVPRGKHILHRLEGDLTIHSHLRMDGSWRVHPLDRRRWFADQHTVRALLWTSRRLAVGDALGMLDLVRTSAEHRLVGHLGPDLLDPSFDAEKAFANLMSKPDRLICEALLDQRNLAGIGTIFSSEPLFAASISPWAPVGSVGAERLADLIAHTRRLLVLSCRLGHTTVTGRAEYSDDDGWVFGRIGQPCKRCGGVVRLGKVGAEPQQRVIGYCPNCQGGLAPGDDGGPQAPLGHNRRRYD